MSQLWRKLVKLFHPDRFAHEPEKQETYHKLIAAINHAKDHGDLATLRRIAEDHRGSNGLLPAARLGGARLRRGARARATAPPVDSIELEIVRVREASNALKESPDYELHRLTTQTPAFFDETVWRHVESLEKELAALERQAEELAKEIEKFTDEAVPAIG